MTSRRTISSRRALGVIVAAIALVVVALVTHVAPAVAADGDRHLIIVSVDALRPEFYLDPSYPAPTLRALAASGSQARAAEPVFPSVTYPDHATIVTGVRPARHGILFNVLFKPTAERGRWYEEAADLRATPIWEWARTAGLTTAAVSWPSTFGARIDWLLPERDYYLRPDPLPQLQQAATPGFFDKTRVAPTAEIFKDILKWDTFLTETTAALIREVKPRLLLLHLVQLDHFQHRGGRDGSEVKPALERIDAHIATIRRAIDDAGIAARTTIIVTGDHGFLDVEHLVFPNEVLSRAGLRGCPKAGDAWRATGHVAGGSMAIFVNPAVAKTAEQSAEIAKAAEAALAAEAKDRYTIVDRATLDRLGAMPGVAFALDAKRGYAFGGTCSQRLTRKSSGGTHGYLPSHPAMATGFIASGDGVRAGVTLDRIRLIDVAPTAGRLLGLSVPDVEGRVLTEILK